MIWEILKVAIEKNASDIMLAPDNYPSLKISGEVVFLSEYGKNAPATLNQEILSIIPEKLKKQFADELELDFAITLKWYGRFRANVLSQRNGYAVVFRIIEGVVPEFSELHLPDVLLDFTKKKSGLVLVTGSVGSGKSTTLASMINEINKNYEKHILTIEDPIEFIHESKASLVEQREVWSHTHSFDNGLKYALRQASDVIMVGEMRDLETFRLALRAAETGNLVFATLHSNGAASTISRVIDMFPWDEKWQIRAQLSESLVGVVWQDLLKKVDGSRVVATEVLVNTTGVSNMIRENHIHQINSAIETGRKDGMTTMQKSIEKLFESWVIAKETYDKYMPKDDGE